MFWMFVILLGSAWAVQTFLSFRQAQSFGRIFVDMRRRGRVGMGRFKGGFVQGAIVLFVIDEEGRIVEGQKLQGVTVAARFKPFDLYDGQLLGAIDAEPARRRFGKSVARAVGNARENYLVIEAGGHAPEPSTPLGRVVGRLPLPTITRTKKKDTAPIAVSEPRRISRAPQPEGNRGTRPVPRTEAAA